MRTSLDAVSWPVARLGEALEGLARKSGLFSGATDAPIPPPPDEVEGPGGEGLRPWIDTAAACLGLEAEPVEVRYADVERLLRETGPALLTLPGDGAPRLIALVGGRRTVSVLGPDLAVHRLALAVVSRALRGGLEAPLAPQVDRLLDRVGVPPRRRERARAAILRESLGHARIGGGWLLRFSPAASVRRQFARAGLGRGAGVLAGAHAIQYVLWLVSWWMLGQGALQGRLDRGWLLAWALLLLTLVPLRLLATWVQGLVAIGAGGLLKQRLLAGALRLKPEEVRHQGAGEFLAWVLEAEAVESLALSGGVLALVAGIELALAAAVLWLGTPRGLHALLLGGWGAVVLLLGVGYWRQRRQWTAARLRMTCDLTERMVGHRTRLAQEAPERWHEGEDEALDAYLDRSRAMDWRGAALMALAPRGWLLLGLLALTPAFLAGASPAALAIALGGVLLAYQALRRLAAGLAHVAAAAIAWQQAAPLFHAASRPEVRGVPGVALAHGGRPAPPGAGSPSSWPRS